MAEFGLGKDSGYEFEIDSDAESVESSDDEIGQFLHGTPEQKRRIRRRSLGLASSSEDEFEKEMELELNATMATKQQPSTSANRSNKKTEKAGSEFYDDDYFDSDTDDEATSEEKKKRKHKVLSNDELLYDPQADDEDQKWVDQQRREHQQVKGQGHKAAPTSDAVLNCPACMTTLCIDCQRHTLYHNQYRAMFVMNCSVINGEVMKYPKHKQNAKKKRKRKHQDTEPSGETPDGTGETSSGEDLYHPVRCNECNTEVAVYDTDEIYHFYNVLASYA